MTISFVSLIAACSQDRDIIVDLPTAAEAMAPAFLTTGEQIRNVPAYLVDLSPEPRPWEVDATALRAHLTESGGAISVASKAPSAARLFSQDGARGIRAGVSAEDIRTAIEGLVQAGVSIRRYYPEIGAAQVGVPDSVDDLQSIFIENERLTIFNRLYHTSLQDQPSIASLLLHC